VGYSLSNGVNGRVFDEVNKEHSQLKMEAEMVKSYIKENRVMCLRDSSMGH